MKVHCLTWRPPVLGLIKVVIYFLVFSTERFEEIHSAVLQGSHGLAGHLHKIWQAAALDGMVKELDEIIIEEHLGEKLKQRARIIEECKEDENTVAW
jgi:hypothetical protein